MFKKITLASIALFLPSLVLGIGVPTSGIDWTASSVAVQSFDADHPTHEANFACFGDRYADLPVSVTLDQLAFSSSNPGPDSDDGVITGSTCFQQAGDYELLITLVDQAGNVGTATSYVLTVKPSEAGSLLTTLTPINYTKETNNPGVGTINGPTSDCTAERLLANSEDDCELRLSLRDDFGNVVEIPSALGSMDVPGRNVANTNLNTFADAEGVFVDGLRLDDGVSASVPFSTDSDGNFDFTVSALAPSIEIITSTEDAAFKLARILSRSTNFSFPIPDIADDGSVLASTSDLAKSVDLQFEPWVKLFLSDNAPSGTTFVGPSDPLYFLLGDTKVLHTFAGTMLDHFLPSGFEIFVKGFNRPVGLFFDDEDLTAGFSDIDGDTVSEGFQMVFAGGAQTQVDDFETIMKSSSGLGSDENVAFGSKIRHFFTEGTSTKTVLYPGGNLGSSIGPNPAFPTETLPDPSIPGGQPGTATALLVGADIEGKILAEVDIELIDPGATEIVNLGGVSIADIRGEVTQNAEILVRGLNPINDPLSNNINFNINTMFTGDVAYFENTMVTLTGGASPMLFDGGIKTIVIRDGNLFIPDDLQYASFDDSLGIILINSVVNDPANGHVFVKSNVQRIAGTYYGEGAILSTTATSNPQYTDVIADRSLTNVDDPSAPLGLQLLLEGTILTKNTLGGALLEPPRGPDGGTVEQEDAVVYDLHFVRRYVPPLDPSTLDPLPDSANNQCVKVSGNCDANKHSFVIRSDGRAQNLTPPGFDQLSGFSAQ